MSCKGTFFFVNMQIKIVIYLEKDVNDNKFG